MKQKINYIINPNIRDKNCYFLGNGGRIERHKTLEKSNICYKYFEKNNNNLAKHIKDLTGGFDPIIDALNLYSNSTYFNDIQKIQINSFKNKIIARKKEVQEHK